MHPMLSGRKTIPGRSSPERFWGSFWLVPRTTQLWYYDEKKLRNPQQGKIKSCYILHWHVRIMSTTQKEYSWTEGGSVKNQNANLGLEICVLKNLLELSFFSSAQTGLRILPEQVTFGISKYSDLSKVKKLFHDIEDS